MTRSRFTGPATVALLTLAVTAGCGSSGRPATAPARASAAPGPQLPPGRIAFRRWLDDAKTHGAIFTVGTDGTGERQLTNPETGADDYPDWSPDGKLIAYQHCAEGEGCTVWTVSANGGAPSLVRFRCHRKGDCDASAPAWMPDGTLLVTLAQGRVRTIGGADQIQESAVEAIDLHSGRQRAIYKLTRWAGDAQDAQVSPDARTVIYTQKNSARSKPPLGEAIFAVDTRGRHRRQVTPWKLGGGDHPVFSPDGSILLRSFAADDSKPSDFWTVRPDAGHLMQLTHFTPGTLVLSASYSPDGAWIVYGSDGAGGADLHVMHADGSGSRVLAGAQWWDSAPDWAPTPR
jgi:TolB protein